MELIEKLERTLALAKELNLSEAQVKELMAVVLDMPITKVIQYPWQLTWPTYPIIHSPFTIGDGVSNPNTITWTTNMTGMNLGCSIAPSGFAVPLS